MFVQNHVANVRLLQIFTTGEAMGFENIENAPLESLNNTVGSQSAWLGQAMFNLKCMAQLINLMVGRGLAPTDGEQLFGEIFAILVQNFLHVDRPSLVQVD